MHDIIPMAKKDKTLESYRSKIDAIDDNILALLKERADIVRRVGEYKADLGLEQSVIRPGREAEIIRYVLKTGAGAFPPVALAAIWRLMIGASTAMEEDLKLAVLTPRGEDGLYWIGREYFGSLVPVNKHSTVVQVLGEVMRDPATIGILPLPTGEQDESPWWMHLADGGERRPKVFAHIPFVLHGRPGATPYGLAVGQVTPESTGHDDITLLVVVTDQAHSRGRILRSFTDVGFEATWISTAAPSLFAEVQHHLFEITDFVADDDPRLQRLAEVPEGVIQSVTNIGVYASPIRVM